MAWRLKSPATGIFVLQFVQTNNKVEGGWQPEKCVKFNTDKQGKVGCNPGNQKSDPHSNTEKLFQAILI